MNIFTSTSTSQQSRTLSCGRFPSWAASTPLRSPSNASDLSEAARISFLLRYREQFSTAIMVCSPDCSLCKRMNPWNCSSFSCPLRCSSLSLFYFVACIVFVAVVRIRKQRSPSLFPAHRTKTQMKCDFYVWNLAIAATSAIKSNQITKIYLWINLHHFLTIVLFSRNCKLLFKTFCYIFFFLQSGW